MNESTATIGGFAFSIRLLEFDLIRVQLASYTRTVMGQEAALALSPSSELREVNERQRETSEARLFLEKGGALEFGPLLDLREYAKRALLGGALRGAELRDLQEMLRAAHYDRSTLTRQAEFPWLKGIGENLPDLSSLEKTIGSSISESGEILDNASAELRQLRQDSRAAYHRLNDLMERNLRRYQRQDLVQEPIVAQRNGRLVLLIKTEVKSKVPGIIHDVSDSGATVFIEPIAAVEPGNQWRELRSAEAREEDRILRHLSSLVGMVGEDFLLTLDLLECLDMAIAKGRYSISLKASAPQVSAHDLGGQCSAPLRLNEARHPLLSGEVVPISLRLGDSEGPPSVSGKDAVRKTVMLITGPNAGGKTVALKTIGLLALMAQAGLHVPAGEARLPLFDGVYADIGDQQSIEQSLSTFSSHVRNLQSIISQATANSLVLLDELGTSTDPEEGSALARAVLGYFQSWGNLLVATTHHRSVARYVQEHPGMVNASVDLDPRTLQPSYRVTLGLPGRSYALTIAARLGLPAEMIEHAHSMLSPEERSLEKLIAELQQERQLIDQVRREAEADSAEVRTQKRELEAKLSSIETTKLELVEQARRELQARTTGLLSRLQQVERSMERPLASELIHELRTQLNEVRREVTSPQWQPIALKLPTWREDLQEGDRVFIRGIPRPVEVVTPPDAQGQIEVLLGTMRAKIPGYQLERKEEKGDQIAAGAAYFVKAETARQPRAGSPSSTEISVRGLRVEEALERIETFLDSAAVEGVSSVRIIHGKGTGTLRRAVRDHLSDHPLVVLAAPDPGPSGEGATVVTLT